MFPDAPPWKQGYVGAISRKRFRWIHSPLTRVKLIGFWRNYRLLTESDLSADLDTAFVEYARTFVEDIFRRDNLKPKKVHGRELTVRDFRVSVELHVNEIHSNRVPTPKSLHDATVKAANSVVVNRCLEMYHDRIKDALLSNDPRVPARFEELHESVLTEVLNLFDQSKKMGGPMSMALALEDLNARIATSREFFKRANIAASCKEFFRAKTRELLEARGQLPEDNKMPVGTSVDVATQTGAADDSEMGILRREPKKVQEEGRALLEPPEQLPKLINPLRADAQRQMGTTRNSKSWTPSGNLEKAQAETREAHAAHADRKKTLTRESKQAPEEAWTTQLADADKVRILTKELSTAQEESKISEVVERLEKKIEALKKKSGNRRRAKQVANVDEISISLEERWEDREESRKTCGAKLAAMARNREKKTNLTSVYQFAGHYSYVDARRSTLPRKWTSR